MGIRDRFPSKEMLMTMSISMLRGLDIREKEEEELVTEVLSHRLEKVKPTNPIPYINTDFKTKQQEIDAQKKVDELRGKKYNEEIYKTSEENSTVPEIAQKETAPEKKEEVKVKNKIGRNRKGK